MATTYEIGQTADASTEVSLYTVPVSKICKFKVLVVNRAGTAATFRVAVVPDGVATANQHYVAYDENIDANASKAGPVLTANASDVIRVLGSTANITFGLYGIVQDE